MSLRGFDWEYYLEKYPDLAKAGINSKKKAMLHYQQYGEAENRFPNKNIEQRQKIFRKNKFYKVNKSNSSKEDSDLLTSQVNDYEIKLKINELSKNVKELSKDITNIKKDVQKINNNFDNLFSNIKKLVQNNNSYIIEDKSSKISNESNNLSMKEDKSSKISTDNKNSKKTISRIESSEEYDLNNNISDQNISDQNYSEEEEEEDTEINNNDVIVKYSNSEENNLNDNSLDNSIDNLIHSSDSFSKNLSYEK